MEGPAWPHGRVLMFSTDAGGRGGIAAVVAGLGAGAFAHHYGIRLIASHRDGTAWGKATRFFAALAALAWARCVGQPRLVHVHTASRASFIRKSILLGLARGLGLRTILHLHGGAFEQYATGEAGPWLQKWIRYSFEKSDAVLVLSGSWEQFVRRFAPAANVMVLSNAVTVPVLSSDKRVPMRVLFLGRIEQAKGIDDLLLALQSLASDYPSMRLVVGGDGDRVALHQRAIDMGVANMLELPGWLTREQVEQELVRANIFVLPSYQEGLPMALLEAMAYSCAVIATAVGGIPQLVTSGVNGLLIAPGDTDGLAASLRRLLDDQVLCEHMGQQARATIEAGFSSAAMTRQLAGLYDSLVAVPADGNHLESP